MPLLFNRDANKPRLTIRERFRATAAKILPRSTARHRKSGASVHDIEPAYSAIAACKAAWLAWGEALRVRDSLGFPASEEPGPEFDAAEKAGDEFWRCYEALVSTVPTTLAGAAAVTSYLVLLSDELASDDRAAKALASMADLLKAMAAQQPQRMTAKGCARSLASATAKILHLPKKIPVHSDRGPMLSSSSC
jgi:hypothetical protein